MEIKKKVVSSHLISTTSNISFKKKAFRVNFYVDFFSGNKEITLRLIWATNYVEFISKFYTFQAHVLLLSS